MWSYRNGVLRIVKTADIVARNLKSWSAALSTSRDKMAKGIFES